MGIELTNLRGWRKFFVGTLIGYLITVIVATISTTSMLMAQDILRDGINQNPLVIFDTFIQISFVGFAFVGLFALPIFLPTIAFAHWKKISNPTFFTIAGFTAALIAIWLADRPFDAANFNFNKIIDNLTEVWFVIPSGMIGGLAYGFWHRHFFHRA